MVNEAGTGRGDLPAKYQVTTDHRQGTGVVVATDGRCITPDSTERYDQ